MQQLVCRDVCGSGLTVVLVHSLGLYRSIVAMSLHCVRLRPVVVNLVRVEQLGIVRLRPHQYSYRNRVPRRAWGQATAWFKTSVGAFWL